MGMMQDLHGPDFEFAQTFCEPADVGFGATARARTYVIGTHVERTSVLKDPLELQEALRRSLRKVSTQPQDYLVATATEVQLEAISLARRRNVQYIPHCSDLRYLLNDRERMALQQYSTAYTARYGLEASSQDSLFFFLGDNPSFMLTWSANGVRSSTGG